MTVNPETLQWDDAPSFEIQDLRRIRFEEGDVLVVRLRHRVSGETARVIKALVQEAIGNDRHVLVLDADCDLAVLNKTNDPLKVWPKVVPA